MLQAKALRKANTARPVPNWGEAPVTALPQRALSRQAPFLACLHRRRGYTLRLDPGPLSLLNDKPVRPGAWRRLEDHWLRGTPWAPVRLEVKWVDVGWQLLNSHDYPIPEFLACKGHEWIMAQAFEPGDPQANGGRVNAFLEHGLSLPDGRIAPVIHAEVTL